MVSCMYANALNLQPNQLLHKPTAYMLQEVATCARRARSDSCV